MVPTLQTLEEGCHRPRSDLGCAVHTPDATGKGKHVREADGRSSPRQKKKSKECSAIAFAGTRAPAGHRASETHSLVPQVLPTEGRLHLHRQGSLLREAHVLSWVFTWTGPFWSRRGRLLLCRRPRSQLPPPHPVPAREPGPWRSGRQGESNISFHGTAVCLHDPCPTPAGPAGRLSSLCGPRPTVPILGPQVQHGAWHQVGK